MNRQEKGSALLPVLFLIVFAGILTTTVLTMSKYNTFTVRPHVELQKSFYLNEGAANRIQWLLAADQTLYQTRSLAAIDYAEYEDGRFLPDSVPHQLNYYGTILEFTVTDTRSGWDMRSAQLAQTIQQLKNIDNTNSEWTEQLTTLQNNILDYIDSDDNLSSSDSREEAEFENDKQSPLPRNAAMQFREELFYISNFTTLFPPDKDGRLTAIRLIPPDNLANLSGTPSIFTADKHQLMACANLEEAEAETVLEALKVYRTDQTLLSDQLDALLYPRLLSSFLWQPSGSCTVRIAPPSTEKRVGKRLTFSFNTFTVSGPADSTVQYLEWNFY